MLKVAVHLHLHYLEMWDCLERYLENMAGDPFDLYVTMTTHNPGMEQRIKQKHPNAVIWVVENRGYDVGPFVYFLNQIDLKKYDLILKIHTKNTKGFVGVRIKHRLISRKLWFEMLIGALIGSKEIFKKNIEKFERKPQLGMVGSRYLIVSAHKYCKGMIGEVESLLAQMSPLSVSEIKFVAGTMFLVRSELMQKIKDNVSFEDFEYTQAGVKDGTLAHVMERVLGGVVIASGYKLKGYDNGLKLMINRFLDYFVTRKITKNNHLLIKFCKIPIYRKKLA